MSEYLLDTDWVVDLLNTQPNATQALPALTAAGVAVSIITYGETIQDSRHGHGGRGKLSWWDFPTLT